MGFTKASDASKFCKYSSCVFLGRSGYADNFWCAWHAENRFKLWVDSHTEFVKWRDSQRESGSYPFDYGHIEYYISDETAWAAIRGQITATQLLEAFEGKRAELQSLINQEVQDFRQEHKLATTDDHMRFCKGARIKTMESPPVDTRDFEAIKRQALTKHPRKSAE